MAIAPGIHAIRRREWLRGAIAPVYEYFLARRRRGGGPGCGRLLSRGRRCRRWGRGRRRLGLWLGSLSDNRLLDRLWRWRRRRQFDLHRVGPHFRIANIVGDRLDRFRVRLISI